MIADLKPYAEYKDSGPPWLGQVPRHWKMHRGKFLFRCKKELNTDRAHKNVLSLTLRGVVNNDPDNPEGLVPKDYGTYQLFLKGNLVFKLIDLENLRTSRVGLVHEDGIMSSAYVRLIPTRDGLQRYFYQQYFDLYQRGIFNQLGAGVRSTLGSSDLLNLIIAEPPVDEQVAIVRFLDHATRRLDKAIRDKRKIIALLNEQKQAIIHRAVTRGLDPDVPLKDSGIPWLGQMPAHWEVLPVKRCSTVISKGTTPSTEGRDILESGPIRFFKAENISLFGAGIVDYPRAFIDQETHDALRRSQLHENDVLFVIAGATLGKIGIVRANHLPANTNQAVAFIRPNKKVTPEFLSIWLQTSRIREQIWLNAVQSAQPNLSMKSLGNFPVPLPSVEEQTAVVQRLDTELFIPNTTISRFEREIELLREYRTRLIADVVTGKLDVREAAKHLPEIDVAAAEPDATEPEESTEELMDEDA